MPTSFHLRPTLPWSSYTDDDVLRRELETLFRGTWHYVGDAGELAQPGDQRAVTALDVPVLLVRDGDGELRAFVNACRHRGTLLVADRACARSITCPYHAWTYGLDGRLRAAPRFRQETGAAPTAAGDDLSLVELRLEQWGPLCFVALDGDAPPLDEWLGEVPVRVQRVGVDVGRLELRHRTEGEVACNWKIACENFLECYHCRIAHPGFCAVVDTSDDAYVLEAAGRVASQTAPRRTDAAESIGFSAEGPVTHGSFHYVFPNLVVNIAPGQPNLSLGPIVPRRPALTWRRLDYLAPAGVPQEQVDALVAWDDQVGAEDRLLVEAAQAGMAAAPLVERGLLMPDSEQLLGWFAGLVDGSVSD